MLIPVLLNSQSIGGTQMENILLYLTDPSGQDEEQGLAGGDTHTHTHIYLLLVVMMEMTQLYLAGRWASL